MPIKPEVKIVSSVQIAEQNKPEHVIESTKPCPKCGKALKLDAKFCGGCGHKFEQTVAVQEPKVEIAVPQPEVMPIKPEVKIVSPVQITEQNKQEHVIESTKPCPKCGKELKLDAKFCGGCGHKFEQTVAVHEPKVEAPIAQPEFKQTSPEIKVTSPKEIVEPDKSAAISAHTQIKTFRNQPDAISMAKKGPPIAAIAGVIDVVVAIIAGGGIYYYKSHTGQTVAAKPEQKPLAVTPQPAPTPVAVPVVPPSSSIPVTSPAPVSATAPVR